MHYTDATVSSPGMESHLRITAAVASLLALIGGAEVPASSSPHVVPFLMSMAARRGYLVDRYIDQNRTGR